ncbi:MAG: RNA polymerase sigma-70 factor [Dysgonamonadaceae bacterium]|jgi:RNA polymerase sigma-70 factor (ECF subfamily)|nr:RNA polymerase sigma-70 factor [Dysgonamonadaceae bacterium]MDD3308708.1 RNA polymerase sigma-70 factor [Dysgonamonadaceae bacterium]MEA5080242.1 RNA polymerase sigma-70 factor [Dysgonamonadaceae bacterium]
MLKDFSDRTRNEDHALFLLIKKRDKEAFTVVYQKYHRYLYSLAYKYLKDEQLASDVIQHVFIKLWESTKDINVEVNLKNYLFTMVKNHILNKIRDNKESISLNYENAQITIPDEEDIHKRLEDKQMNSILYKGIDLLPPQKKEVCLRKLNTSDSNQQIADEMGISIHTVKSHYQESLKMLKEYFKDIK